MSLRKSTCLTPQRLDAARRNSQRSTGPRSQAGKERMKMNALKHGCDAARENEAAVMRALGEDPERYAALQRELAATYGPGDALWDHLIADLGKLYWRRNRIERMETGLMRRALQAVEERQRARRDQIAAATFDASSSLATDPKLAVPAEPCARLRQQLSRWTAIHEQLRQGMVTSRQYRVIQNSLGTAPGWRPARIAELMLLFSNRACCLANNDKERLKERVNEMGGEANVEVLWRELLRLLEEEIAAVQAAFEEEVAVQEEKDEIERDCCLAPEGKTWEMLLRQEAALDRSIDRKVRIILAMRQEHARQCRGGSRTARTGTPWRAPTPEASPPGNEPDDRATEELSKVVGLEGGAGTPSSVCDSGQGSEALPSLRETQTPNGGGLRQPASATQTESPAEENGGETSKSLEQSQHVIENKAPATKGVRE